MEYKVSVIVPVYNVEKYIEKCILSILSQSYKNYELILINDGSTDSSLDIILKYENNPSVRIINKENTGQADTRYQGLLMSQGEYIYYVDSDDFIEPYTLEKLVEQIEKHNADVVFGRYRLVDEYGKILREQKPYKVKKLEGTDIILSDAICVSNFKSSLCVKLIKKQLLIDSNIEDVLNLRINEDVLLSIILASHCNKVVFINDIIYNVLQRENSLSRNLKPELITSNEKIFSIIRKKLINKGFWDSCFREFYNGYIKTVLYTMAIAVLKSKSFSDFESYFKLLDENSFFYSNELKQNIELLYIPNKLVYYLSKYPKLFYYTIKSFKLILKY